MHCFFRCDIDQIGHVFPDCALPVFIEGIWKPKPTAVRQRTKAGIKVVKTRINQLHRDSKATEHFCDGAVRLDVGTKFVTAKEHVLAEERVAFAFEVKFFRQPIDFIAVLLHPFGEKRLFSCAFFVAEIAGDESAANRQPGVGGEDHVRQPWLRRDQMNLAKLGKRRVQSFPLLLHDRRVGAVGDAHPRIDLVLDAVVIRRTKKQLAHTTFKSTRQCRIH
ncbi:MAG: hypothetical protein Udaeo_08660 [Candidatus Udaeobacter sp.]|nr:MAG: hypothetical protein Udaeo_08660 [Candidatus Udaeobacter sp.]